MQHQAATTSKNIEFRLIFIGIDNKNATHAIHLAGVSSKSARLHQSARHQNVKVCAGHRMTLSPVSLFLYQLWHPPTCHTLSAIAVRSHEAWRATTEART